MQARCADCPSLIPVPVDRLAGLSRLVCDGCGRAYPLGDLSALGGTEESHAAGATALGDGFELDALSAYSVLVGTLTLDGARERRDEFRLEDKARELAARHRISPELARRVAGRSLRLHEAKRRQQQAAPRAGRSGGPLLKSNSEMQKAVIALGLVGLALGAFLYTRAAWQGRRIEANAAVVERAEPGDPADATRVEAAGTDGPGASGSFAVPGSELDRDGAGRVTRIRADGPEAVLLAFCATAEGGPLEPLELAAPLDGSADTWYGRYRDPRRPSEELALTIRRNRRTGRWIAGDGRVPLDGIAILPSRLGTRRIDPASLPQAGR